MKTLHIHANISVSLRLQYCVKLFIGLFLFVWCMFNLLSIDFSCYFPLSISFIFSIIFRHDFSNRNLFVLLHELMEFMRIFVLKTNGNETDCVFNLYFAQEKERCMHIAWKMCSINGKFIFIKDFPLNAMAKRTAYAI